ncbi:MAG: isochorismate synthase [Sandaracinaceae bacterium]|nr:isochorismate synthase [Sandaracinaceae bacterium]
MSAPLVSAPAGAVGLADAGRFLDAALARGLERREIAIVRLPAPLAPLTALTAAARRGAAITWRAPDEPPLVAIGACASIHLAGPDRFAALEPARGALFAATASTTHPAVGDRAPRLFGGWAFAPGGADREPWESFGDGRFFLPRWTYERTPRGGVLTAAVDLRDGWAGRRGLAHAELATVLDALARPRPEPPPPRILSVRHPERDPYAARVRAITAAIAEGELSKVVAARRAFVAAEVDLDPWSVLRTLSARYPETWRFGLRFGSGTLLAATPERLFSKRGRRVEADALAGSIAASDDDGEARLAASAKDLREHRPVVEHLLARLAPVCEDLDVPSQPSVRRLPNVLHLHTRLAGTLAPGVDAASLVARLHPTPAVGGVPADAANAWIAAHEPHPRGWYGGPVGWVDANGDAEITVALRAGVVRGAAAWLWAGGGIVEGSEPDAEWSESALKLRPLLDAIGAE